MRHWINLIESYVNENGVRYDSNPSYFVKMEDEETDEAFPVWINPSKNTFFKIIGSYDARGLIYKTGQLVIWDQHNLYHSDVYNQIDTDLGNEFITIQFGKNYVAIKSDNEKPIPFTDEEWLPIVKQAVSKYYGPDVTIEQFNWF